MYYQIEQQDWMRITVGIVIQWYVAPYTDNTEWYVALMLAAGVWGGVGGG